jgi:hypothetical protein
MRNHQPPLLQNMNSYKQHVVMPSKNNNMGMALDVVLMIGIWLATTQNTVSDSTNATLQFLEPSMIKV